MLGSSIGLGFKSGLLSLSTETSTYEGLDEITLPKTNIAPENRPSQKETSIPTIHFQVLC